MKILVAGDCHSELHEEAVCKAFKELGHEVLKFGWHDYFKPTNGFIDRLSKKIQNRFITGPIIGRINRDFVKTAALFTPDLIFVYRGTHLTAGTLEEIKRQLPDMTLVGYNNDDPFAKGHHYALWRHFLKSVPQYDLMFAYRHHNLDDFLRVGAKRVELLRSWYFPERNHPVSLSADDSQKYECDVVFIGHYEADDRKKYLEELVRQGFRLRLFGPGYDWDPVIKDSPELKPHIPVRLVWGEEYNKALCGAKVALCFLSKLNRDTYTRRCFEIPATGTLMLSEYTDDQATLYKEGEEADYFRNEDELIEKVRKYLNDEKRRQTVAANGYRRVLEDGHDVVSRMKQVLESVKRIELERKGARV
jgi:spore maturation protein CgeB